MPLVHPAAMEEQKYLSETLAVVEDERRTALQDKANAEGELSTARMYDQDALPIRELLYLNALTRLQNLSMAKLKPYFTRIDFVEDGGAKNTYYIGKYGILRSDNYEVQVVDWRAPIANLYYSGQIGPMQYRTPEGEVHGELTLKRQLGIENSVLETIFDTDIVSQDAYLQSVLGAMTGDRLREIVTTIQAEQNFVIRHPLEKSLIVQGVAGSGKTTIALHRIAYLLYAYQDVLQPDQMLILAPNPLFLNFISGVLPDLGVDRVHQSTFSIWMTEFLGADMPQVDRSDRTDAILAMREDELDRISRIAQVKGALSTGKLLEKWLDRFEETFCPREGIVFGPVTVFSHAELEKTILVDEKPFPMQRRMKEFKKQLKVGVKSAAVRINAWLTQECERRVQMLLGTMPDSEERRQKVRTLYASRDARQKETLAQVTPFIRKALELFPKLDPQTLYHQFWHDMQGSSDPDVAMAAQETCMRLSKNKLLEAEDLALFALIAMRVCSLKSMDIRHVVVDEAQDFSALEYFVLRKALPLATMTIVGDMMQGVHSWRAIADWSLLQDGVFGGKAVMHHLVTSYRSTMEIMDFAARVARNCPVPGQQLARPVLRHGDAPEPVQTSDFAQRCAQVAETIVRWRESGYSSIAIIARHAEELDRLLALLPKELDAHILDINKEEYHGGVVLAHAGAVKGLEFDGVIVLDASEDAFPGRSMEARLLYVCLTRALHRLRVFYSGKLSPLLAE